MGSRQDSNKNEEQPSTIKEKKLDPRAEYFRMGKKAYICKTWCLSSQKLIKDRNNLTDGIQTVDVCEFDTKKNI